MSTDKRIAELESFMEHELLGDAMVSITKGHKFYDVWIKYNEAYVDFKVYTTSLTTLKEVLKDNAKVLNRKKLD